MDARSLARNCAFSIARRGRGWGGLTDGRWEGREGREGRTGKLSTKKHGDDRPRGGEPRKEGRDGVGKERGKGGGEARRVNGTNKLFCELPRNSMNGPCSGGGRKEAGIAE